MDSLVARLPTIGKKVCLVGSQLLMLYATWLFLSGSWTQTVINLDVKAPASGLSTGFVYGVGVVFRPQDSWMPHAFLGAMLSAVLRRENVRRRFSPKNATRAQRAIPLADNCS